MRLILTSAACALAMTLLMHSPGLAQGTRLPFSSTFETGDFSEWDGFRNTTGAVVTDQGCFQGRCVRTPLVAGTNSDTYGDFYFADHVGQAGAKVEEVWLSLASKFDPGLTFPSGQKIAILNLTDGVVSQRRYQVILFVQANGEYAVQHSDIANWNFWNRLQNLGPASGVRLGQWDQLKLYVRLNTPGASDGILRLWINNELKLEHTNVNIRFGSNYGMNKLILSTYATPPSPTSGVQWHDSIRLQLTNPDQALPTAPRNLRIIVP